MASASPEIPAHVAIIMDGNGRWAQKRLRPRVLGHRAGRDAVERCVEACAEAGISVLTLFAFSTENWQRPKDEVNILMDLMSRALREYVPKLVENQVRLQVLGDREQLSPGLRNEIATAESKTASCGRMDLILALNYSGRWAMLEAARTAQREGVLLDSEAALQACLPEPRLPPVDLLIRTSGEMRISNFLLWELAYAELYFTDTLWPDFNAQHLDAALAAYAKRDRRFGGLPNKG
ncbi:di-trans,poly-cis-decaprenylcistransferase [Cardiobacteriaceae bacterium TAE3-ERU3]|nr:di-trans,poly-cis-decaprenylcistransferase [Cardiobacteriaceae bacterium TAE3-ERU3]